MLAEVLTTASHLQPLNGWIGHLLHQKHYKVLKQCIYKVLYALEQATKSCFQKLPNVRRSFYLSFTFTAKM